jgi:4-hydroxy-tetrahydrodipicolinate synthase
MIPAMKRVAAEFSGQPDWAVVRPPLVALDDASAANLMRDLRAAGFSMPGFAEAMR